MTAYNEDVKGQPSQLRPAPTELGACCLYSPNCREEVFSDTRLPVYELLRNSRPMTQHYDWYLPVGLPLILRVGWVLFYDARPQPRPLVPLRCLCNHRVDPLSELYAHLRICAKVQIPSRMVQLTSIRGDDNEMVTFGQVSEWPGPRPSRPASCRCQQEY